MITLTVTQQEANLIIGALRQLPHAQVHDLVMKLFAQTQVSVEHIAEDTGTTD